MTLFSNILVAVEESPAPVEMLKVLLQLPASRGAQITALHAVRVQPSAEKHQAGLEQGRIILAKTVEELALGADHSLKTILRTGDPKEIVSTVAEEVRASLLIMGSRGLNNLVAILSNSVSQYVFQRASCPMLLLRDSVYATRIQRVAVAVSDSMAAKFALKTASDVVRQIPNGELILIRVRTQPLDREEEGRSINPEQQNLMLATAAEFARQQGVPYKIAYSVGSAGQEICRLAQEYHADLLVLGCQDRRPTIAKSLPDLDRLLGNSVSDYVRTQAPCPVLIQKTPA